MPQQPPKQPNSETSSPRYNYSHLREEKNGDHWYAHPKKEEMREAHSPPTPPPLQSVAAAPPSDPINNPSDHDNINAYNAPTQVSSIAPSEAETHAPLPHQGTIPPVVYPVGHGIEATQAAGGIARQRIDKRRRRKASGMPDNWAWVVIATALLGVTVISSMLLVFVIRYSLQQDDSETLAALPLIEPTSILYADEDDNDGFLENSLDILARKWDGSERFTILLMGLDKRPDETGTVFRTDSMILISLDPRTNSIGMLSIPRDLYVEVPYAGLHRVNAAYVIGELEQPGGGGGPRLAKQTVQYNFGMRVHEYVTVDFEAVIDLIDAIGGIEVDVERRILDYTYPTFDYGTEVFQLNPGLQTLDGATALKFARTRHDSDDIDRARRQQQVIYAVRDRVVNFDIVADLVVQAPFLYTRLSSGVQTGLTFDQLVQLGIWASDVPRENITSGVVSWEYLSGYETPTGGRVVVPNRARIGQLMVEVFGEDYNQ